MVCVIEYLDINLFTWSTYTILEGLVFSFWCVLIVGGKNSMFFLCVCICIVCACVLHAYGMQVVQRPEKDIYSFPLSLPVKFFKAVVLCLPDAVTF